MEAEVILEDLEVHLVEVMVVVMVEVTEVGMEEDAVDVVVAEDR